MESCNKQIKIIFGYFYLQYWGVYFLTCNGTAISAAINARKPLKELFVATAVPDLPTFASTIYASVLA
jgi:hypothetical protein